MLHREGVHEATQYLSLFSSKQDGSSLWSGLNLLDGDSEPQSIH